MFVTATVHRRNRITTGHAARLLKIMRDQVRGPFPLAARQRTKRRAQQPVKLSEETGQGDTGTRCCQDNRWLENETAGKARAMAEISYRRHRFPPVIIQHAVWLYLRFTLSYRDVEELLAERGSASLTKPSGAGC